MERPVFSPANVRDYYDRNTAAFVRLGQGGGAIHRAVWGPGVATRADAFHYVDDLIGGELATLGADSALNVLDLGCGVAATLCYLARRFPIQGIGVTLSPQQVRVARRRIADAGLDERVTCVEADYTALPPSIHDVDLAYAIESFVHGPSPERFVAEAARVIRPGGLLIVCDDVRREGTDPAAERVIATFARGWHVNSLVTAKRLRAMAEEAGFTHLRTLDLTPLLELGRPRDKAIRLLSTVVGWLPFQPIRLAPLLGGSALQTALRRGWLAYDFTVFRRTIA